MKIDERIKNKYVVDQSNPIHYIKRSLILKEVKELSKATKIGQIADVGCGFGTISQGLARFAKVDAYDINAKVIGFVKQTFHWVTNPKFYLKNLFTLKQGKYDLVVCSEVLQYVSDDDKALKKINSILKPHGYLILTVPFNKKLITEFDKREKSRRYSLEEIVHKMIRANFKIIKIRYWGYPLLKYFYLKMYVPRSNQEAVRVTKAYTFSTIALLLLKFSRYLFLLDLLFNSNKAMGLLIIGEKNR